MSDDWKVGDLAVCVDTRPFSCGKCCHTGKSVPPFGQTRMVGRVGLSTISQGARVGHSCGCLCLYFTDGSSGIAERFRKIRPDEHEPCEQEFRILLNLSKRRVKSGEPA